MSTPPSTETFVTGDRVTYKFGDSLFTGAIQSVHPRLEGWWLVSVDGYGVSTLRGSDLTKDSPYNNVGNERIDLRDLPPIPQESLIKHYECRERELVQWITHRLEERILDWQEDLEQFADADPEVYAFDSGFTAGLRAAIQITEELTSKLTKETDPKSS